MLTRSHKSVHSIRSLSTDEDGSNGSTSRVSLVPFNEVVPSVFEQLLPYICKKFNCDFDLLVKKELHRDGVHRYMKPDGADKHTDLMSSPAPELGEDVITITAVYDKDTLAEIFINNQKRVPRFLMQAINEICAMSSHYEDLNKVTIRHSKIEATIVYELNKLVSMTYITDVCLDGSFIKEGNYYILLDKGSFLQQLSLCRCFITDEVCHKIVSKLHFPSPAEKNLLILNLSGNCITDEGAKSISVMLRSNRNLQYLNLAGNRIEDEGALSILDVLREFPLTFNEIDEKQRRLFAYLKRKNTLTNKFMNECEMQIASSYSLETVHKDSTEDVVKMRQRAKLMAKELIGISKK
ncbi:hypothetical protein NE865_02093 [Phthorimaea operculella]|nr:hypothetical protein NE865_02093 [Phthorimaea operculella]